MTVRVQSGVRHGSEDDGVRFDRFTSKSNAMARFVAQRIVLQAFLRTITTIRIVGRGELRTLTGAFVVVANHSSHLDAPLVFTTLPRRLSRYLAAGAAADYFFDVKWRRGLTSLFFNAFPIQRSTDEKRTSAARELLDRGVPLLVFPEGTRTRTGAIGQFKPGAAVLATRADVPCVPVAIIGADVVHPRGSKWPKSGRPPVGVAFGAPVFARAGEPADEYMLRVRHEVLRLHEKHADLIAPTGGGGKSRGRR